jgi:hypothetical protein
MIEEMANVQEQKMQAIAIHAGLRRAFP